MARIIVQMHQDAASSPATGYGVAVFDLDPGERGGETSITVTCYHAAGTASHAG